MIGSSPDYLFVFFVRYIVFFSQKTLLKELLKTVSFRQPVYCLRRIKICDELFIRQRQ